MKSLIIQFKVSSIIIASFFIMSGSSCNNEEDTSLSMVNLIEDAQLCRNDYTISQYDGYHETWFGSSSQEEYAALNVRGEHVLQSIFQLQYNSNSKPKYLFAFSHENPELFEDTIMVEIYDCEGNLIDDNASYIEELEVSIKEIGRGYINDNDIAYLQYAFPFIKGHMYVKGPDYFKD